MRSCALKKQLLSIGWQCGHVGSADPSRPLHLLVMESTLRKNTHTKQTKKRMTWSGFHDFDIPVTGFWQKHVVLLNPSNFHRWLQEVSLTKYFGLRDSQRFSPSDSLPTLNWIVAFWMFDGQYKIGLTISWCFPHSTCIIRTLKFKDSPLHRPRKTCLIILVPRHCHRSSQAGDSQTDFFKSGFQVPQQQVLNSSFNKL